MFRTHSVFLGLVISIAVVAPAACSAGDEFQSSGGSAGKGGSGGSAGKDGAAGDVAITGGHGGTNTDSAIGGSAGKGAKSLGATCDLGGECSSGYCADGVCCESDCPGTCRTCNSLEKPGQCEVYAAGLDPEGECVGTGAPTDPCAGHCGGTGACEFPDGTKSCGSTTCAEGTQTGQICNGAGACTQSSSLCGNYKCGASSCLTTCTADTECTDTAWCNGTSCDPKKKNGDSCTAANQCTSGFCADGHCCNVACSAPFSCTTGQCLCNGVACVAGDSCINWYADTDGDGYGDKNKPKLGCSSQAPTGYVKDNTDCYDQDAKAHPTTFQTQTVPRGDGSWDWDCDGVITKQYSKVSVACVTCGSCLLSGCDAKVGFGCSQFTACPLAKYAFTADIACGQTGTLMNCYSGQISGGGCTTASTASSTGTQGCR